MLCPFSKDFITEFSPDRALAVILYRFSHLVRSSLSGLNLMLKVLGKEFEEEPFFKRVFLNITRKITI